MKRAFKWSYFNYHSTEGDLKFPKQQIHLEVLPLENDSTCLVITNLNRPNTTTYLNRHEIVQVEDDEKLKVVADPPDYAVCEITETVYDLNIDPKRVFIGPNPYLICNPNYSHVLCLDTPNISDIKQRDQVLPAVFHNRKKYTDASLFVDLDLYGKVRKIVIDHNLDPAEASDYLYDWLNKESCQRRLKEFGAMWELKQLENNSIMANVQEWLRQLYLSGVERFRWSGHSIDVRYAPDEENKMRIFSGQIELNPIDLGRLGLREKAFVGRL